MRHLHPILAAAILVGCGGDDEPTIDGAPSVDVALSVDAPSSADVTVVPPNDTDLDGLSDAQEDRDGDGVVDPGESDPTMPDSDGDGVTDLMEWAAGSDPLDPAGVPPPGVLPVVVPPGASGVTADVSFQAVIHAVDLVFMLDSTGGSALVGGIITLQNELQTVIVPGVSVVVPDAAFAVTQFKDFPVNPFGGTADMPHALMQRITTVIDDVQAALDLILIAGGFDGQQSGMEALFQTVTGEGIEWTVTTPTGITISGEVEKFESVIGYDPAAGHGLLGGVGFRDGAYPIVFYMSEIEWHDASEYWAVGIADAHSRDEAVDAAYAAGARFLGATSSSTAIVDIVDVAFDTRAVVPMSEAPSAPPSHCMAGMCAVTMTVDWLGTMVPVADAVDTLLTYGPLDVFARASGPIVDGVDPAIFIESIAPASPAPPGTVVDGDTLRMVPPHTTVPFTVTLRNDLVMHGADARVWSITISARAEARIDLGDEVTLLVIVPARP